MGPWCALWVVLTLLRAVQDKTSTSVAASGTPSLLDFQKDQFQGEWYVVGLAGNAFRKEDRELLNPYTATFELTGNGHIQVSYAMTRGQRCVTWAYTLNPASQPGHFEVDKSRDPQADSEEVQVTDSDYTTFGLMLSRRNSMGRIILRITLLGRSWTLRPEALDKFICLVRAHHLSDEQIVFPAVIAWKITSGNC
ncbi:epididymal-specific lipocalin-12-like isoform X2 [Elephas maximus indicus]|uniref:epididymal-specific lipocalin-12-like isoform X2 n=1 Tax=Elephas maximus indicus TaxID=99487 RepID=UPI002116A572|nr:epididymal-specific lipocalin-12-like isoform X2 [Elephas maximus indicus]